MDWENQCYECGKVAAGYEPIFCCNDTECGCMGAPINPPICAECVKEAQERAEELMELCNT